MSVSAHLAIALVGRTAELRLLFCEVERGDTIDGRAPAPDRGLIIPFARACFDARAVEAMADIPLLGDCKALGAVLGSAVEAEFKAVEKEEGAAEAGRTADSRRLEAVRPVTEGRGS
jgi:hypothetical protein